MALHRLESITVGVPDVAETVEYYSDFGLRTVSPNLLATADGGEQLRIVACPSRRLLSLTIAADDVDDLERTARQLERLHNPFTKLHDRVVALDPATGIEATVRVSPRLTSPATPAPVYNGPGRVERRELRAPGVLRTNRVRPRKLGHVVVGSTDQAASTRFFVEGIGFKISDRVPHMASFLRCSADHHNLLIQHAPVNFLHHTAWEVDDVDEVGRGATAMLEGHPERHVWGLGRHHIGSNFFWYLKDPAGNFSEYYSDLDCIIDDQLWTPETFEGARGLFNWGPPPPPSFLQPEDLASLMTGAHGPG
ncbi:VOC family protein [Nocardia sp. R7R-8]|uniref:VOC family protein n=1 Tax=Nocardia sp. R7R-8 TaxID=3459304 RepID=UPI00403DF9D2